MYIILVMNDSDLSIGDVVRVDYEDEGADPIYIGIVTSFDELGVEVEEVHRITSDEVLHGFKTDGWTVEKIGVEYNEASGEILTEDSEWVGVSNFE